MTIMMKPGDGTRVCDTDQKASMTTAVCTPTARVFPDRTTGLPQTTEDSEFERRTLQAIIEDAPEVEQLLAALRQRNRAGPDR